MSRYIDAEVLCRENFMCDCEACEDCYKTQKQQMVCEYYSSYSLQDFCAWISETPTADVTKVICCKDCFYAKPYNAKWQLPIKEDALWCTNHEEEKTQGWFCADAIERMVEDGKIH